ncbi:MAG: signal peptidase I [Lachnospiraceae bacterium]|nr:signal peptidase I [Candidatus Merdinaster equi]
MGRRGKGLHFYQREKKINKDVVRIIFTYLFLVVLAVFIAGVLAYCLGTRTSVIGDSMEPVLYNGQEILINRVKYSFAKPERGDVIVFLPNGNTKSHYYVKRVVGLPGEKVQIIDGRIYINDERLSEPAFDKIAIAGIAEDAFYLAEDEFFVLGDNVNSSEDSRSANIGPVKLENIYGSAWYKMGSNDMSMGFVH